MRRRLASVVLLAALLGGSALLSGCQTVEAWQKGNLAEYAMRPDSDPLEDVMSAHVQFSREGATGGEGVGGGGCGCN